MHYVFFEAVLEALGQKLTYEAISNFAGNSFCEKAWEMISENNPMELIREGAENRITSKNKGMFDFLNMATKTSSSRVRGPEKKG